MPNFRLHQKKHLTKKNKKRKLRDKEINRSKKRRKIDHNEEKSLLDPKIYKNEIQNGLSQQMIIIPNKKYQKEKPKKKKKVMTQKMSKTKMKKMEQLKRKRRERKEMEEYFRSLKESKIDKSLDKLMIPVDKAANDFSSKEKIKRKNVLESFKLDLPEDIANEASKKMNRKLPREMTEEAMESLYYKREKPQAEKKEENENKEDKMEIDEEMKLNENQKEEADSKMDEKKEENAKDGGFFNLQFNFVNQEEEKEEEGEEDALKKYSIPMEDRIDRKEITIQEQLEKGPLVESKVKVQHRKIYKMLNRKPEIEEQRSSLPIYGMEQEIMETIHDNDVVIICGETGSGKTTQIPQFLYEGGYGDERSGNPGMICVTQPRRVAAVSTARRVSEEMNTPFGKQVGVQIRHYQKIQKETKVKFMTDGILLKEIQSDSLLLKYSIIVLDEAHERNTNTDILIGWLARILPLRNRKAKNNEYTPFNEKITPLKLVIMSATLRISDFTENKKLFSSPPPVINVKSRQFPVTLHFNKKTALTNYVEEAKKKAIKIHENLPQGGILIFMTGKSEIDWLVSELKEYTRKNRRTKRKIVSEIDDLKKELKQTESKENKEEKMIDEGEEEEEKETQPQTEAELLEKVNKEEDIINKLGDLDDDEDEKKKEEDNVFFDDSIREDELDFLEDSILPIDKFKNVEETEKKVLFEEKIKSKETILEGIKELERQNNNIVKDLYVLPLYSKLNPDQQFKVFRKPPKGCRLCVVATNVAETSLTIPGVRYVIDPGRVKTKQFEKTTGAMKFVINWIPQSSSNQRAGRAGRTCPGHCYRLYSTAVYEQKFKQFSDPDILTTPIDNIVLQMKAMDINNIPNFPFPTPPKISDLNRAIKSLVHIQALKPFGNKNEMHVDTQVTPMGRKINEFPLNPRYGKMILLAMKTDCLDYIISIVSLLTVGDIFVNENQISQDDKKNWYGGNSDYLCQLKLFGLYMFSKNKTQFCEESNLRYKSMIEIAKLNKQLGEIAKRIDSSVKPFDKKFMPPTAKQRLMIRQIICAGLVDQFAKLVENSNELNKLKIKEVITNKNRPYITFLLGDKTPVCIHPSSFLHGSTPRYVVYKELQKKSKYYMKGITVVNEKWVEAFGNFDF